MNRFSIVAKQNEKSLQAAEYLKGRLMQEHFYYTETDPEFIITVGGDGTLLYAVHQYLKKLDHLYFIAVHTGTLGFYTDYGEDEIDECIQDILNNNVYEIYTSSLLKGEVISDHKIMRTVYALNEVRIENILTTQTLDVYIDDEYFETIKGNGICLSTQAGATAYNRSLKGAVVDNGLQIMQMVEIAGLHHKNHNSLGVPYIMKNNRTVTFLLNHCKDTYLCFDHEELLLDDEIDQIRCMMSEKKVRFVRFRKYSYLKRLRNLY